MSDRRLVVLDKSFLMGAGKAAFADLSSRYDFLATDTLLGECFQVFLPSHERDDKIRERNVWALLKFAEETSRLYRIAGTGFLIGIEARTRRPCWPIEDYIGSRIQFNPTYFDSERRLRAGEAPTVEQWSAYIADNVQVSLECYEKGILWLVSKWDESLVHLSAETSQPSEEAKRLILCKLPEFRKRISEDENFVRTQYAWMRPFGYPSSEKISPRWLLFRSSLLTVFG